MKTYAFNLLPQKARSLVKKEEKRDNYALLVTIFPLLGVILWLIMVLVDGLIIERYQQIWNNTVIDQKNTIENVLSPILVRHGELVKKTNGLSAVITKDIKPEELFILLDEIYANQDSTFSIVGYGRKQDGAFLVNIIAQNFNRFSEITRRFSTYKYINNVKIDRVGYDPKANNVSGSISFFFYYEKDQVINSNDTGTTE